MKSYVVMLKNKIFEKYQKSLLLTHVHVVRKRLKVVRHFNLSIFTFCYYYILLFHVSSIFRNFLSQHSDGDYCDFSIFPSGNILMSNVSPSIGRIFKFHIDGSEISFLSFRIYYIKYIKNLT